MLPPKFFSSREISYGTFGYAFGSMLGAWHVFKRRGIFDGYSTYKYVLDVGQVICVAVGGGLMGALLAMMDQDNVIAPCLGGLFCGAILCLPNQSTRRII